MSSTHDWPLTDPDFVLQRFTPGAADAIATVRSPFTGRSSFGEVPFAYKRTLSIEFPSQLWGARQRVIGFLHKIRKPNFVRIPMLIAPAPQGTMRGSPTVNGTAAMGSTSINITGTGTLKMGDFLGVTTSNGAQVICCTADATLAGLVGFEPPLRGSVASGSAVVWDKPWVTYVMLTEWKAPTEGSEGEPLAVDLEEVW